MERLCVWDGGSRSRLVAREWFTVGRLAEGEDADRIACGTLNSLVCCVTEGELEAESMVGERLYADDGGLAEMR